MNSVWRNIVTIPVYLQVFWQPGWSDGVCSPCVTEHGQNLGKHSTLQMKRALLLWTRPSVGRRRTKRTQCLDGRVLRRQQGCTVKTTQPWEPFDGTRRRALQLCWCLCYAPSRLGSEQTRSETLCHLPRPTSVMHRSNICCLQRSAGTHASEPELGSSAICLHDYRTSGPQSEFMYGTKLLRKLYRNSSSAAKCHVRKGSDGSSRFRFDSFQDFKHFIPKYFQIVGGD